MPESASNSPSRSGVPDRMHEIARLLREVHHLGPEAQRELAELADELGNALGSSAVASTESAHLADSTAHLVESLRRKEEGERLTSARERLEQAIIGAGARTPFLAGIARRLLNALADIGI